MACTINLFSMLTGSPDSGGSWAQSGGNPQSLTLSGGHLGTVDFTGAIIGSYLFTYNIGTVPCNDSSTVTVTVNAGADSGETKSYTYCNVDAVPKNLFGLLGGTPDNDGTWSGNGTASAGYSAGVGGDPTDNTFTPSLSAVGIFSFIYTVNHGDGTTPGGCTNCTSTTTMTITVTAAADAGGNGVVTVCN